MTWRVWKEQVDSSAKGTLTNFLRVGEVSQKQFFGSGAMYAKCGTPLNQLPSQRTFSFMVGRACIVTYSWRYSIRMQLIVACAKMVMNPLPTGINIHVTGHRSPLNTSRWVAVHIPESSSHKSQLVCDPKDSALPKRKQLEIGKKK